MFWNKNIDNIENLLFKILTEIKNIYAVIEVRNKNNVAIDSNAKKGFLKEKNYNSNSFSTYVMFEGKKILLGKVISVYSSSFVQKMIKKINEMPCEDLYVCYVNNGVPGWLIARTLNIPSDRVSDLPFNRIMKGVYLWGSIENIVKSKSLSLDKTISKKRWMMDVFLERKNYFRYVLEEAKKKAIIGKYNVNVCMFLKKYKRLKTIMVTDNA